MSQLLNHSGLAGLLMSIGAGARGSSANDPSAIRAAAGSAWTTVFWMSSRVLTRRPRARSRTATGEYTIYHGGTVSAGLAAIAVAMNRVNGIYQRDLSIFMELVANNNLIVYTNPSTDPYTNNNGGAMLSQNQSNLDSVIGAANYDIGPVFSTGGGGIASLGCVCINGR